MSREFINISLELQQYCKDHSTELSTDAEKIYINTVGNLPDNKSRMLSGFFVAKLLEFLVKISQAKTVIEIGLFTGFSALQIAKSLPFDGKLFCFECSSEYIKIATDNLEKTGVLEKIKIIEGKALDNLPLLDRYLNNSNISAIDLVFIDAQKSEYQQYIDFVCKNLKKGGIIVLDNTLQRGNVLHPDSSMAKKIVALNADLAKDPRFEVLLLPIQDGITILRYKS